MPTSPFLLLHQAKFPISKLTLSTNLLNFYNQCKLSYRFESDKFVFDDANPLELSSEDDLISIIDPDSIQTFFTQLRNHRVSPHLILQEIGLDVPHIFSANELWIFINQLTVDLQQSRYPRLRLPQISSFDTVLRLFQTCKNIVFLVGAGISVSSGIPDFRSKNGIYANLEKYELKRPTDMFDLSFFKENPLPFFKFVPEIMPQSKYKPTLTHKFISQIFQTNKLCRIYTQNIDCLELKSGVEPQKILSAHGSFASSSCMVCKKKVGLEEVQDIMLSYEIPLCQVCCPDLKSIKITDSLVPTDVPACILKPDIVFFGEKLVDTLSDFIAKDSLKIDLLIVMGSSLKVKPIAGLIGAIPRHVPQILINRERISGAHEFDVEMIGNCDDCLLRVAKGLKMKDISGEDGEVIFQRINGQQGMYKVVRK
ncbi:NAD-dependent histone deacetylase Sir2 [Spironucleus salmonicida]|uniref:NAD-dependent histone deacetylase Sir2 n=1 Tax=Spironucleus salmonicida TaxID=348837 RepID=V6LV53_9EUKA|nr:NAD-dependent histone deacetylase Sir2 [Spironucleus salmonicida]|eukprot:EST48465.1 NAD-dependent histone deacetylase Sir2 [Spironucleus salmonicida]